MRQEDLPKANAICKVCGTKYYVCKKCIELHNYGIYSWRLDCDSEKCYKMYSLLNSYKNGEKSKEEVLESAAEIQRWSSIHQYVSPYKEIAEEVGLIEKPLPLEPTDAKLNNQRHRNKVKAQD